MFHFIEKPRPPSVHGRARHHRPVGGFLGDHQRAGILAMDHAFSSRRKSMASRFSLPPWRFGEVAGAARVVEVEHRGDGIDAQAVEVELLEPVQRARDQEARTSLRRN
jgi:hypothetical protein